MSDYGEKLENELTASFLGVLVKAVRRCDYGIDRRKLYDFVRWCFENEGKDYLGDEAMERR